LTPGVSVPQSGAVQPGPGCDPPAQTLSKSLQQSPKLLQKLSQ